ncbi:MAG: hypothetical protein QXJ64_05160 [Thermosphaera sp.]
MISELLLVHVFEGLDKQIVGRIPYLLLFSLLTYLMVDIKHVLLSLIIISLATFLSSTILFDITLNKVFEKTFTYINFKEIAKKIVDIVERKISILDDIRVQENVKSVVLGLLSGVSFAILLSASFLMLLYSLNLGNNIIIPLIIFLVIYVYQDLAKADLLEERQLEGKATSYDIMSEVVKAYLVDNLFVKLPKRILKINILKLQVGYVGHYAI